jgi:hypothetical protein
MLKNIPFRATQSQTFKADKTATAECAGVAGDSAVIA